MMSDFYSKIQLRHYLLSEINLKVSPEESLKDEVDFTPSFAVDENKFQGVVELGFTLENKNYSISGSLLGIFEYSDSLNKEEAKNLLINNGTTILFPYLRTAISNITSAANVPNIIIPTINVIEFLKEKYKDRDDSSIITENNQDI